jgi:hemerythrin superfamily protein
MSDPVRQLVEQHNQLRRLFKQLPRLAGQQSVEQKAYHICDLLTIHSRLEEEIIYPVIGDLIPAVAKEAQAAHDRAERLVAKLCGQEYRTVQDMKRDLDSLERVVSVHARWEEDNLLPLMNELTTEEFNWLGSTLYERHQELLREYPDASDASAETEGYSAGPLI